MEAVAEVEACPTLNAQSVIYFEWDKADLTSAAAAVLDETISNIRSRSDCSVGSVSIVGHTDSSGGSAYNQRLANRRSAVVRDALVSRGITAEAIGTDGKGESELAKATRDGVREPLNRRAELTIIVR